MSARDSRRAWATFWSDGGAGPESGCLPNALQTIDAVQRTAWQQFASELSKGARVIDLATGDGAVLGKLRAVRPDCKLLGVDSSPVLPPQPPGIKLRTGIMIESLPFPNESFDAVTSQFGYEYGETDRVAAEVHRVLKPGGKFQFVVHYREGPILAHNLPLREALSWAVHASGYLDKARVFAKARAKVDLPTPAQFRMAPAEARQRFPAQPIAEEFLSAVLQTLELSRHARAKEVLEVLQMLQDRAENQIGRVDSLERAARNVEQLNSLVHELVAAGLVVETSGTLSERAGDRPFAWLLKGSKPIAHDLG